MRERYADIIVDISQEKLDRTFQYKIPPALWDAVSIGKQVRVPFGKGNREITGYVIGISQEAAYDPDKMKEILDVDNRGITIESKLITLAGWIREQYGSTMNQALKTVLPVKKKIKAKEKKRLFLCISPSQGAEVLAELERKKYTARARLLRAVLENGDMDYDFAVKELQVSYPAIQRLKDEGIIREEISTVYRNPVGAVGGAEQEVHLTLEQKESVRQITEEWAADSPRPCLLHGITGSGKTLAYMEVIQRILENGREVIVLIPEIALTYQTVRRFYQRFGDRVSVINSRMSQGERFDQFERAREGKIQIMVGPRSALFTPFQNLGLIIIDEEHEASYISESTPRYHAREVAIERAGMEGAYVLLGSATPSVDSYYKGEQGIYKVISMNSRFEGSRLPSVYTVDLREELKTGNRSIISGMLRDKIQERLDKKEQVMLFLNRRGYSGFIACRSCGYVVKCPHCDVSLSIHTHGKLICHYCGYETQNIHKCPECGSPYIGGFRAGTQQIEEIVRQTFPKARVLRMDLDTTKGKHGHEHILSAFAGGEADILVGTQMIVKGHDFPKVTLVGILAADMSLFAGNYRAGERTFQLLTQAVGRAGRGSEPGEAVIQTYHPEHYSIQASVHQDYREFYEEEIGFRLLMGYPPAASMLAVHGICKDEEILGQAMHYMGIYVQKIYPGKDLQIIGPAWEAVAKVNDMYRMVLYMKHEENHRLIWIKNQLERYIRINSGFDNVGIQFDFNV